MNESWQENRKTGGKNNVENNLAWCEGLVVVLRFVLVFKSVRVIIKP